MRKEKVGAFGICSLVLAAGIGVLAPGCSEGASNSTSRISRIEVPGYPFRVAAGKRFVWVLGRGPGGACAPPSQNCLVVQIDPLSNRVVGNPVRLPGDGWDLTVGAGSVWVTQFDGRVLRIDPRTRRITPISARPLYFGSVVAFGDGSLWTGNDDERNKSGGTIGKVDPATNRLAGAPVAVARRSSPQSISFGGGALWVADHAGWLAKIDPATSKVVARSRLSFGPHGVAATDRAVYVADAHANRILEADPNTAKIRRAVVISPGAIFPVIGGHWLWASSAAAWAGNGGGDDRVLRIDPATLKVVETLHVGGSVPSVGYGFGSVWAADHDSRVVRITPPALDR